jgi:hypothetical protein
MRVALAALAVGITVVAADASPPPVSLGSALPGSVTVGKAFTVQLKCGRPAAWP